MTQTAPRVALGACLLGLALLVHADRAAAGRFFYVRQTLGDDANDGRAPERAFRSVSMLDEALVAGDTAYVGPGLYRDQVFLRNSGTAEAPIRIVADATGRRTGDLPGPVLITGADPVDEGLFVAASTPGVFEARIPERVAGVVELDGAQQRYRGVLEPVRDVPYLDQVRELSGSFYYDPEQQVLTLHTSDGRHPSRHELELIRRTGGISMTGKHYVIVEGFAFRHMFDAGIVFWTGSGHGAALNNVVWGSRQGIRVNGATDILLAGNTLFRNENSGVYFLNASFRGAVVGNTLYENAKGARWSSQSNAALAVDNVSFDNREAGISIESVTGAVLLRNRLVHNRKSQLLAHRSAYVSEGDCLEDADAAPRASQPGPCGAAPEKIDVGELHARSSAYAEAARRERSAPD